MQRKGTARGWFGAKQGMGWMVFGLGALIALQSPKAEAEVFFRALQKSETGSQSAWGPKELYVSPEGVPLPVLTGSAFFMEKKSAVEVRVFLSGQITHLDLAAIRVMETLVGNGSQKISGNMVWMASDGGDADSSMAIARVLRARNINTFVAKGDLCASACVFAFMGGARRLALGRLGIHRPYLPVAAADGSNGGGETFRAERFRHMRAVIKQFVEDMDFPSGLYDEFMRIPPEDLRDMPKAEMERYWLNGVSPATDDAYDAVEAARLNLPMAQYLPIKAKKLACLFPIDACALSVGSIKLGERTPAASEASELAGAKPLDSQKAQAQGAPSVRGH